MLKIGKNKQNFLTLLVFVRWEIKENHNFSNWFITVHHDFSDYAHNDIVIFWRYIYIYAKPNALSCPAFPSKAWIGVLDPRYPQKLGDERVDD